MAYFTYQQAQDMLGKQNLQTFLDEDGNGVQADIMNYFNSAASTAQLQVDSALAGIYQVPFTSVIPPMAADAALTFFCEMVYSKRIAAPGEANLFQARADDYRKKLNTIRENGTGLDYNLDRAFTPGFAFTVPVVVNTSMI